MDIFAFSRTINLFLRISTNEKTLANVKGVLGAQVFMVKEIFLDKYEDRQAFLFVLSVSIHLEPQQWMCDLAERL